MLSHLDIRNLALVDRAELELEAGMSVLTGETGAGKSMLLDAVSLAIGERASASAVRPGAERAEVVAIFDLSGQPGPRAWLAERELDHDQECILRRTVSADGRSRAFINDRPVPAQTLRELGEMLVDIHGQHAHQSLLRRDTQRQILDEYGNHARLLEDVAGLHRSWRELHQQLDLDTDDGASTESRLDFLRFQLDELEAHDAALADLGHLLEEHRRLSHGADIETACEHSLELLQGETTHSVASAIGAALSGLQTALPYDENLAEPIALLGNASSHVDEAASALQRHLGSMETDQEQLRQIDATVSKLHDLARKHRVKLDELPQCLERLRAEIDFLASAATRRTELRLALEATHERYVAAAAALSKARKRAAKKLATALEAQIRELGMETGKAHVKVAPNTGGPPGAHGLDIVELEFSANAGTPLRPLAQVASGGELSRIGLAIQVIASRETGVGTFIFDEVDAGIGGRLADMVGARLRSLGENRQVLCVTHLPQVASHAAQHVRVTKGTQDGVTCTMVAALRGEERIEELARMLGGAEITDRTIAHARELLTR